MRPSARAASISSYGGKVGRVAVVATHRRSGVGAALMQRLHDIAREQRQTHLWCNAQLTAVPFYERLGYVRSGPIFVEAGIDHVRMECELLRCRLRRATLAAPRKSVRRRC